MKDAGVSRKTFYGWMKDKRFIAYLNSKLDQYTDSELSSVWRALINQCVRGNVSAMKLFFELKELHPDIKLKKEAMELAKVKAQLDSEETIVENDGFIEALAGTATVDWSDYEDNK